MFPHKTIQAAAHLLATLHQTDGKVGAPLAWRNTLESAMFEAWKSIGHLQGNNGEKIICMLTMLISYRLEALLHTQKAVRVTPAAR